MGPVYSLGVTAVLLVLAALRQLAAARETRRLYRQVDEAAAMRAQVMQRGGDDRHRVAESLRQLMLAVQPLEIDSARRA